MAFQPWQPFGKQLGRVFGRGGGEKVIIVTTPVQSLGAELLTDGGMENWVDASNLVSWSKTIAGTSSVNRDASAHSGSFAARLDTDGSNSLTLISQNIVNASGDLIEQVVWVKSPTGTTARMDLGNIGITPPVTTSYVRCRALTQANAANTSQNYFRTQASKSLFFDDGSDKKVTPNTQLIAPSSDMRLTALYTLPTPDPGTAVWVMPRISAFSTGNYWAAVLVYTGSQWNIDLYSVAAFTRTSRTSATNIGTTNGIRVNCKGDLLDLQTSADGGASWTTRGSQVNNSLYDTATNYNVVSTSDVTLNTLTFESAL